ncbi:6027_t:CDS:10 [Scutellospora calospora]|uniref:6027_t:CDS:1 n=1 Tax=Scutellospora calospora TaxID=85575 RepID=A0ACA9KP74_9GLOM|nr:6027_t:CDS:10 [Scutellospora calospora]
MGGTDRNEVLAPTYADYERERLERIEQNKALLAKLGLVNFSLKPPKPKRPPRRQADSEESQQDRTPSRKSPRIEQMKPRYNLRVKSYRPIYAPLRRVIPKVTKTKYKTKYKTEFKAKYKILGRNNQGRRFYGGRIYDSEIGTTCHQCRQKTIEDKVQCTNVLENGTLCKVMMDERCLIGRYGETLEEARSSGEWNCPKCRGVCNCSFCRRKKGLPATGILKHLALAKGYNSVMEYLDWLIADLPDDSEDSDKEFVLDDKDFVEDNSDTSEELASENSDAPVDLNGQDSENEQFTNGIDHRSTRVNGLNNVHSSTSNGRRSQNNGRYNSQIGQQSSNSHTLNDILQSSTNFNSCPPPIPNSQSQVFAIDNELQKLDVPFPIFSEQFTQFHEEQEMELKSLAITDRQLTEKQAVAGSQVQSSKVLSEAKKMEHKDITDNNRDLRDQAESIHKILLPIFNSLLNKDEDQLDAVNIGPFLLEFARKLKR